MGRRLSSIRPVYFRRPSSVLPASVRRTSSVLPAYVQRTSRPAALLLEFAFGERDIVMCGRRSYTPGNFFPLICLLFVITQSGVS